MAWTLKEIMDSPPPERRKEIDRRYEDLLREVEAGKSGKNNQDMESDGPYHRSKKNT